MGIGQAIVHHRHARGIAIAEIADLDWRGFPGKDQQAMMPRMPGEIHQDVNPVLADLFRHLLI